MVPLLSTSWEWRPLLLNRSHKVILNEILPLAFLQVPSLHRFKPAHLRPLSMACSHRPGIARKVPMQILLSSAQQPMNLLPGINLIPHTARPYTQRILTRQQYLQISRLRLANRATLPTFHHNKDNNRLMSSQDQQISNLHHHSSVIVPTYLHNSSNNNPLTSRRLHRLVEFPALLP
jgi:hypothetical protein